jgi:transcriptional regulator with XRE-family HTH domain
LNEGPRHDARAYDAEASREKAPVGDHGEDVTLLAADVGHLAVRVGDRAATVTARVDDADRSAVVRDTRSPIADALGAFVSEYALRITCEASTAGVEVGSCDKLGDMALGETLLRVQRALNLNQKELARLIGCSSRTIIRYYQRGGALAPATYAELATACHPHDVALAAHLAQQAGKTLASLGLVGSSPVSAGASALSPKHLVDSIVCAAAEAMQAPPHTMRPALTAAFERAIALGMTAEDVLRAMT